MAVTEEMAMRDHIDRDLRRVAEQVADALSADGYAFVEDDKIEALAVTLRQFLAAAGIRARAAR
jgi:hypothetical protein